MTAAIARLAPSRARDAWIQLALVPALFYAGAKLSLVFAVMPEVVVILWIPNSILLATLLHYGWRRYPLFAALVVAVEIAADYPSFSLVEATAFGALNVAEASIAYALLRRWRFDARFGTPADITKFVIAGPVIAALATACFAALVYSRFRGSETPFVQFLRIWWFSDGLGLLILAPLALTIWPTAPIAVGERIALRWYDAIAIAGALLLIVGFLLSRQRMLYGVELGTWLLIPPALYAVARFGTRVAIAVVAAISLVILQAIHAGRQPFGDVSMRETVALGQEFLFVMGTMCLGFIGLVAQHRAQARALEARVKERTAELRALNERLEHLAITDPLTGLLNRRALFEAMRREMAREQRHSRALSLIVIDVDHFKRVNDRYGHAAGDAVLQRLAATASRTVRESDVVARYGGEEFVVLAPDTDEAQAVALAERIRSALASASVDVGGDTIRFTASFGVATMRDADREPQQVLQRADRALYAAKAAGRDRVVLEATA